MLELIDDGFRNDYVDEFILSDTDICNLTKPGEFCPSCGNQHCSEANGHKWNDNDYCIYCGADGRA